MAAEKRRGLSTAIFVLLSLLAAAPRPAAAAHVRQSSADEVLVDRLAAPGAVGALLEVQEQGSVCGLLMVTATPGEGRGRCRLVAGSAPPGAGVTPITPPGARVALLTDRPRGVIATELKALFPTGITVLGPEGRGLDPAHFDAAVVALYEPASLTFLRFAAIEAFAAAGRPAFVGLTEYASRRGLAVRAYREGVPPPPVRCARTHPVLAGLSLGDVVEWYGRDRDDFVRASLPDAPPGAEPLLVSTGPNGGVVGLVEPVGERGGFLVALDLQSPNGRAGSEPGAYWKWVPLGNAVAQSVRFARALCPPLSDEEILRRVDALVARYPERLAKETLGADDAGKPIHALRLGQAGNPTFVIEAGARGADWVNSHALLRLAEVLATPQADPRPQWLLQRFCVLLVPAAGVPRPLLTREPVIGWVRFHTGEGEDGWQMLQPGPEASPDAPLLHDLLTLINSRLAGRFAWNGVPLALQARPAPEDPAAGRWAGMRRIAACAFSTLGGADGSTLATEVVHEACLSFMQAVGLRALARPAPWVTAGRVEIEQPAGHPDLIAFLFGPVGRRQVGYWRHRGSGTLRVPFPDTEARLLTPGGAPVELIRRGGDLYLPVDEPLVLDCGAAGDAEIARAFRQAELLPPTRHVLWVGADAASISERMRRASHLRLKDAGALTDFLVCDGQPGFAEVKVEVPVTDTYTVWARLRHPSRRDGSFTLRVGGASEAPEHPLAAGEAARAEWCWVSGEAALPSQPREQRLRLHLSKGTALLRLQVRGKTGDAETNPRLDMLCLTNDPEYVPRDRDVPGAARRP